MCEHCNLVSLVGASTFAGTNLSGFEHNDASLVSTRSSPAPPSVSGRLPRPAPCFFGGLGSLVCPLVSSASGFAGGFRLFPCGCRAPMVPSVPCFCFALLRGVGVLRTLHFENSSGAAHPGHLRVFRQGSSDVLNSVFAVLCLVRQLHPFNLLLCS